MISFSAIMRRILTETMSFKDLYRMSDPARVDRSRNVHSKSLRVTTMNGNEAWTFSYKSSPSTTGQRWQGYVRFLKEDVSSKDSADELDCVVDCNCPDYRFRWAYNNAEQGAGVVGNNSLNKNNGQPPKSIEQGGVGDNGPGLCKHLISLGEYLKTNIEPTAPQPKEPVPIKKAIQPPKFQKVNPTVKSKKPTINAPAPNDTYSDSRDSGYSDSRDGGTLQESKNELFNKINNLVTNKPEFEIWYQDEK